MPDHRILVFSLAGALAGCALVPASIHRSEEQAATALVAVAERTLCRDIPVGTWRRLYADPVRHEAWAKLCAQAVVPPPRRSAPMSEILRQIFTGKDNQTHDLARWLAAASFAVGLGLTIYVTRNATVVANL